MGYNYWWWDTTCGYNYWWRSLLLPIQMPVSEILTILLWIWISHLIRRLFDQGIYSIDQALNVSVGTRLTRRSMKMMAKLVSKRCRNSLVISARRSDETISIPYAFFLWIRSVCLYSMPFSTRENGYAWDFCKYPWFDRFSGQTSVPLISTFRRDGIDGIVRFCNSVFGLNMLVKPS